MSDGSISGVPYAPHLGLASPGVIAMKLPGALAVSSRMHLGARSVGGRGTGRAVIYCT